MSARPLRLAAAMALALAVAACGGAQTAPAPAAPPAAGAVSETHDDADVRFARMMIPHHRQAVEMAELADGRTENPDLLALAAQIRAAQGPEIATMTRMLEAWGAEVPAPGSGDGGMSGMDHGGMDHGGMSGMMSPAQMSELRDASGAAFDRMFLQLMIAHHEGAVADAQRAQAEGVNPQAVALAGEIIATQTAEIERMRQLLQEA